MHKRRPQPGAVGPLWVDPSQVAVVVGSCVGLSICLFVTWRIMAHMSVLNRWDQVCFPACSMLLLINAVAVSLRSSWLTAAALSSMVAGSVFMFGSMAHYLFAPSSHQIYSIMAVAQYALVYYMVAFAVFKSGAALMCWVHYAAMALLLLSSMAWAPPLASPEAWSAKALILLLQPCCIFALGFLVRLRDEVTAKERATQKNREELLAMMSHEIRGPLQIMLTSVDLLSSKVKDLNSRRAVARLGMVTEQLDRHLRDLVEFTRLDNPELAIEYKAYDLTALIESVVQDNTSACAGKGLTLSGPRWAEVKPRTLASWKAAMGDPQRIRQVLNNLISNATKYTPEGCVQLAVLTPFELPGWVQIEVRDTGVGIPADQLQHIFEPFARLQSPHLPTVEGSGLGLAIAARLVARMGGNIRASSNLGRGSCFNVVLPLAGGALEGR